MDHLLGCNDVAHLVHEFDYPPFVALATEAGLTRRALAVFPQETVARDTGHLYVSAKEMRDDLCNQCRPLSVLLSPGIAMALRVKFSHAASGNSFTLDLGPSA